MPTEQFKFQGSQGQLSARLDLPDGPVLGAALFAHCFTCSKDIPAARRIASRLAAAGIAVLRFDFTGLGHSDGEFENTGFSSNIDDLVAAANHMAQRNLAPGLLIGHSLGGAAVLAAAGQIKSAKAVVTLGAPFEPGHVTENFNGELAKIKQEGKATVTLAGRPFIISKGFVDDINAVKLDRDISNLKKALLVMHAPGDTIVSVDNAASIFTSAKHPKSFITLDNADHLISSPEDAEYVADVISAWATRYMELRKMAMPIGVPEGIVRVSEADAKGFLQDVHHGPTHHTLADEPLAYGGSNRGMSPYGFVSAGLGACTSMTLRMYARRKGWPLTHVSVDVTHNKVHAQDAEVTSKSKIDVFTRKIRIAGDLDDAQRQRLLEIADRCPVHRTLEHKSKVETLLV